MFATLPECRSPGDLKCLGLFATKHGVIGPWAKSLKGVPRATDVAVAIVEGLPFGTLAGIVAAGLSNEVAVTGDFSPWDKRLH